MKRNKFLNKNIIFDPEPEKERQCPHCDGAGGWESTFGQFIEWICCQTCNGEGLLNDNEFMEQVREKFDHQTTE